MKKYNIGLFGFGCVGQGLYQMINQLASEEYTISRIAIKNPSKPRIVSQELLTLNPADIWNDEKIDVFVEAIDDADEAFRIVSEVLRRGKPVVTANKKLVATRLKELLALEKEFNGVLLYEAAVCGAIPVIRTLDNLFEYERVTSIRGIFNGTSNFILSAIFNDNISYDFALKQAQNLGFAETNPESDVGGFDAKYKAVILAKHIYGVALDPESVVNFGIDHFTADDIRFARNQGLKIKLIPQLIATEDQFAVYVLPHFVTEKDRLYHVENELNGVQIEGEFSGTHFFNGRGAGAFPTAFSVLNDIRDALQRRAYTYSHSTKSKTPVDDRDVFVEIYLRYRNDDVKKTLRFSGIREGLLDDDYKYIIGNVSLRSLAVNKHLIQRDGASVIATGIRKFTRETRIKEQQEVLTGIEVVN